MKENLNKQVNMDASIAEPPVLEQIEFPSTEQAVLQLLRQTFSKDACDTSWIDKDVWPKMYRELLAQTVAFLPIESLSNARLSKGQSVDYRKAFGTNFRKFHILMSEQAEVLKLLEVNGIKPVVLKGAAAAVNYPHPEYRQMGDIDLIVEPEFFEKAKETLLDNGYKLEQDDEDYERHAGFNGKHGIEIELHHHFSAGSDNAKDLFLDQHIYDGIRNRVIRTVCGYDIPTLPTMENGLVLLGHIKQHLLGGLGLRQIIDWMMFVENHLNDNVWDGEFKELAEAVGMRKLAETVTLLCKNYLGLDSVSWCDSIHFSDAANDTTEDDQLNEDAKLASELMGYIFSKGNFGYKEGHGSHATVKVMHNFRNPLAALRYLMEGGMFHWKLARKYRVLRPFAVFYQIGHLIRMGLRRKVGMAVFKDEYHKSKREADFLKRLGIG